MRAPESPPAAPYAVLCGIWAVVAWLMVRQSLALWSAGPHPGGQAFALAAVLAVLTLAQVVGAFFLLGFLAKAAAYLFVPDPAVAGDQRDVLAPVAVLYLTAGDFDPVAVDSLLRLEHGGRGHFVLHDDGNNEPARREMREFLERHPCRDRWQVSLLHRPERVGGKAGAVNWVLERLAPSWELLVLCDSDSIALEPDALLRVAGEFADPSTAVVQFRNVGHRDPAEGRLQQRLARAIDVFDAFASPQARWGFLPCFGHNAVVRLADLRRLGGLTPGFFSDDLDLSVRLALDGRRIVYRRDIAFAERHPADWVAFRKRARKWAFGCMQVIRARAWDVCRSRRLPFAHRVGLLEFMGFYPAQALLLAGLVLDHLVLPLLVAPVPASTASAVSGGVVVLALLAPTLAWSVRERRLAEWPALAWGCVLVYGGSILSTARGVVDGLSRRERPWIPTNLSGERGSVPSSAWGECALGLALFVLPWLRADHQLAFAASYLFVATFLFSPLTYAAYREPPSAAPRALGEVRSSTAGLGLVLCLSLSLSFAAPAGAQEAASGPSLTAHDGKLWAGFTSFEVRGVHYSPWLPGTAPDGHSPYPDQGVVVRDLQRIRALGANTVLIHDAPARVIRCADSLGMRTLYSFNIQWNDTTLAAFSRQGEQILSAVDSLKDAPGLAGWILGNEIPAWVVEGVGQRAMQERLATLAARVRERDPHHLLAHGNWPPTRQLDLSFLDLACFNLYPTWPYEVVVRGYGRYLREELVPLARGRPLVISEFGVNSLEAGEVHQAEVISDCWHEITASKIAGGVVFEWCDEWWKNFDNPVPGGKGYWDRQFDLADGLRHDADPEENYGLTRADRSPKLALAAVARMWAVPHPRRAWAPWLVLVAMTIMTGASFGLVRRAHGEGRPPSA